jgi:hypothetical protein
MTLSNETLNSETKPEARKAHLLNDQSFKRLLKIQKEVAKETGWMPSLSTLVNALVNTDNLVFLKEYILSEFEANKKTNTDHTGKTDSIQESV